MIGHHWLGIVGILLITLADYDAIKTTLSASHSGPLTNRSISTVWTLLLALHQRHRCHRVLSAAGPWLTVGLMTVWLLLALAGWWLLFCSTEDAVVNATTKAPANDVERLYYAGYTWTTLGYGDFVPGSDTWRLAPPLAAANGFFLFTLTITYMLSIIAASYCSLDDTAPSHTSQRSRPLFLALYNAVSAKRSSLLGSMV